MDPYSTFRIGMALDGGAPIPEEAGSSNDPPKKVQRSSIHVEHKDSGCRGVTVVKRTPSNDVFENYNVSFRREPHF